MLSENNKFVYDLAMDIMDGTNFNIPKVAGHSERLIEVPTAAHWLRKFSTIEDCKILDIGFTMSSLDWLGLLLRLKKTEKCIINAMDIVKPERVKSRYPKEWLDDIFNVPVEIGDIREKDVPTESYDVVTCISTIEHIGFDKAEEEDTSTAFKRYTEGEELQTTRAPLVDEKVLAHFHSSLKPGGHVIITVPIGKGGVIPVKDSMGLVAFYWEYERNTWHNLITQDGFELIEQQFYAREEDSFWHKKSHPKEIEHLTGSINSHAKGCAIAVLKKT